MNIVTPFNEPDEPNFNLAGLRRLDFVECDDGWVYAFDMGSVKRGEKMDSSNSIRVFRREVVLPQAYEFVVNAPLLFKTLLACHKMQQQVLNCAEQMQSYLKQRHGLVDKNVDFIVNSVTNAQSMIESATNVPVIGREAAIKMHHSPVDTNGG